jgi:hypothetical protein
MSITIDPEDLPALQRRDLDDYRKRVALAADAALELVHARRPNGPGSATVWRGEAMLDRALRGLPPSDPLWVLAPALRELSLEKEQR